MGSPYPANDSISREEKAAQWVESVMIQTSNFFFLRHLCVSVFCCFLRRAGREASSTRTNWRRSCYEFKQDEVRAT